MKHWINRRILLWKFLKVQGHARELELEWQRLQQEMHDKTFEGQHGKEDYMRMKGFCDGVEWCLKRFS